MNAEVTHLSSVSLAPRRPRRGLRSGCHVLLAPYLLHPISSRALHLYRFSQLLGHISNVIRAVGLMSRQSCVVTDRGGKGAPLPPEIVFVPIVLLLLAGCIRSRHANGRLGALSKPILASFPLLGTWLDLSRAESIACILYFSLSALPIVLSGLTASYFNTAKLAGNTAAIALALLILPATRTSLWVRVFGLSFERTLVFHRWMAWWAVAALWTHTLLYLIKAGTCVLDNNVGGSPPLFGFASVIMFTLLSIASLNFIRRRFFEVFRSLHWLFIPAFGLGVLHTGTVALYGALPAVLYIFDRVRRYGRSEVEWTVVEMKALGARVTHIKVRVPASGFEYEAGQYCFINIPALSKFQWHPFSLTSHPATMASEANPTISFAIKAMGPGTWSHDLLLLAQNDARGPTTMRVDGPFGGLSRPIAAYKHIAVVGGGIGATPCVSILQQLCAGQGGACERVTFVWTVREASELAWAVAPLLTAKSSVRPKVAFHIHISAGIADAVRTEFPLTLQSGRPDITALLLSVCGIADKEVNALGDIPNSPIVVRAPGKVATPPLTKEDVLIVASGPEPLVTAVHTLCMKEDVAFTHEAFLF